MSNRICARCKQPLDPNAYGESGIYRSHHRLCDQCFDEEDKQCEHEGTNDLPDVLAGYGPENDYD